MARKYGFSCTRYLPEDPGLMLQIDVTIARGKGPVKHVFTLEKLNILITRPSPGKKRGVFSA